MNMELIEKFRYASRSTTVGPTNTTYSFTPKEIETFVELIVKECIDIIPWQYQSKIVDHFGVK